MALYTQITSLPNITLFVVVIGVLVPTGVALDADPHREVGDGTDGHTTSGPRLFVPHSRCIAVPGGVGRETGSERGPDPVLVLRLSVLLVGLEADSVGVLVMLTRGVEGHMLCGDKELRAGFAQDAVSEVELALEVSRVV